MIGPRLPVAPRTSRSRYGSRRGLSSTWRRGLVGLVTVAFTLVPTSPVQAAVLGPPVTNLTLSLSSDAASATEVTYAIGFVMPAVGAIVAQKDQITLDAPTGTFVAVHRTCAPSLTMTDMTTNTSRTSGMCTTTTSADDSRLSIPSPINIGAGDRVQLMVPTLVNPRKVGVHELSIESSISGATPVGFQTVRAGAIGGLSLVHNRAGGNTVTYTVGFTTSPTGALAAGTGTISVQAPPGSFSSHPDCSSRLTVSDLTTKGSMSAPMSARTINRDGSQLVISPPIDIGATDDVQVVIPSVRNPAEAGPHDVTVGTSSDGSKSLVFGNSAAHAVSDLTFSATTLTARASEVVYTIGFTTSGSGGLPAGSGTIVVQAAAGTFPVPARCANAIATITDLVTHASSQDQLCLAKESGDGAKVDLVTPFSIGAGQAVRLAITDLHNPDVPGPTTVSVATSSDAAGFATYTVVGVGIPITALSVAASTLAAGATGVTYTFDFATSAVGALAAGSGDIIVRGPAGTFPANPACGEEAATVTDLTTKASGQDPCTATLTADGTQLQITTPVPIGGGHSVRLAILGLDNPLTRGVRTLSVSTSSNSGESGSYRIVSGSSVGAVAFAVSNPAAGAPDVTYGATFALPPSGALVAGFGAIDITVPPGTFASSGPCSSDGSTVTDLTTKTTGTVNSCSVSPEGSREYFRLVTPVPLSVGDKVALAVPGWLNPAKVGLQTIWLSTSSSGVPQRAQFRTRPAGAIKGRVLDTLGHLVGLAGPRRARRKEGNVSTPSPAPRGPSVTPCPTGATS